MEIKLKDAFETIKMDDACADKIQQRMDRHRPGQRYVRYAVIAAACAIFLLIICSNPNVVQALEDTFVAPILNLAAQNTPTEPEITVAKPEYEPDYRRPDGGAVYVEDPKKDNAVVKLPTSILPTCLKVVDGRLFFTANGENMDITDSFSQEIPFTYIFTDKSGYTHYMAVGGAFDSEIPPYGGVCYQEWIRDPSQEGDGRYVGWLTGGGTIPNDPEEVWVWLETAKTMFDVPWK